MVRRLRERRGWSRGQVARRLQLSTAVLYNVESGRSRPALPLVFALMRAAGLEPAPTLGRHLFSVKELGDVRGAHLVAAFRSRLKLSQRALATSLGYRSAAMIHHFEKGLREPDLDDLFALMRLAGDDLRGFVLELTGDEALAAAFPSGDAAARRDWLSYWSLPSASAIRQLMRTHAYERLEAYEEGAFARALGISLEEERAAFAVLRELGVVKDVGAKPVVDPAIRIVIPQGVPRGVLDGFKARWIDDAKTRFLARETADEALCSVDLIPVNRGIYEHIVQRIRSLQDEIHNLPLTETDGFACLGWLGAFVPLRGHS